LVHFGVREARNHRDGLFTPRYSSMFGLAVPLALLLFFGQTPIPEQGDLSEWTVEHFKLARQAQLKNNLPVAATEYELVVARKPKFAEAHLNLGIVYHQQKKYREAIQQLQTASSLKPNLIGAHLFLGIDLYMIQEFQKALEPLQRALALDQKDRQAAIYLALVYIALDRPFRAIQQLRKTARDFPNDAELSYHLGEAFAEALKQSSLQLKETAADSALYYWAAALSAEQRYDGLAASESYLKALAVAPNVAELYLKLGFSLERTGIADLASAAFRNYSLLNPSLDLTTARSRELARTGPRVEVASLEQRQRFKALWDALPPIQARPSIWNVADDQVNSELAKLLRSPMQGSMKTALSLYAKGDYRAAADRIGSGRLPNSKDWASAYVLARAYILASDYESAQDVLEGLLLPYLDLPSVALLRVEISSQLAIKYFNLVSSKQPDSFRARTLRAKYLAASNQTEDAIREYQEILELAPNRLGIHLALGNLYSDKLDWASAIESYRMELALSPENGLALSQLGHVYVENRDADLAIEILEKLKRTRTTDARAYADLGNAWRMKGSPIEAISAYEHALTLNGSLYDLHYRLFQLYKKTGDSQRAQIHMNKFQEGAAKKRGTTMSVVE